MKMIFFDTETTGLRPGGICQLSYIIVDKDKPLKDIVGKNLFFSVEEVEPSAEAIHGFSVEDLIELSDGNEFSDLYEEILKDFNDCDMVIGHNVQFDIKFLKAEFERLGINYNPNKVFCTMACYKDICKLKGRNGDIKNPKLSEVVDFLHITEKEIEEKAIELFEDTKNFHDARFDTAATFLIILKGTKKGVLPKNYLTDYAKN